MIVLDEVEQNTPEWFQNRLGSLGGYDINTAASKGSGRQKLLYKKAAEILSQTHMEGPRLKQFDRGHLYEAEAREYFAMRYRIKPRLIGMVKHDDYKHISPDFLIENDDDAFAEIKIREPAVFLENSDKGNVGTAEGRQMQWGFRIMKKKHCYYIQYCPEYVESDISPLFVMKIYPDEKKIRELDDAANGFIGDLKNYVEKRRAA